MKFKFPKLDKRTKEGIGIGIVMFAIGFVIRRHPATVWVPLALRAGMFILSVLANEEEKYPSK